MSDTKTKRRITNTSATPEPAWLLGGNPRAIEAQEARGQEELCASSQLPTEGSNEPCWAAYGITLGAPCKDDPIWRPATLPAGWRLEATDHSMWSKLLDERGRERGTIFYKAAFYDRSAFIRATPRFVLRQVYEAADQIQHEVTDCGVRVFATDAVGDPIAHFSRDQRAWNGPAAPAYESQNLTKERQRHECAVWLAERYPNWKDPAAHWADA